MSTNKTQIDHGVAEHFVQERFHVPNLELEQIEDGETAQAFYFETGEGARVLRINSQGDTGFHKDQFAQTHFGSVDLPIPRIFEIGEIHEGLFFAISERVPGKTLDKLSGNEINSLMPKIISTLDAIHATPPAGDGFGTWDTNGNGRSSSWREELQDQDLRPNDNETTSASFYDRNLAKSLREEVGAMLDTLPNERRLMHSDYGFNNTLSDGTNITGVIDWEHSSYGDFVRDIAWLDFWNSHQGYADAFKKFYYEQARDVSRYDERLMCYKLLIGYGALGFFAKSRQPDKYEHAKEIVNLIPR